MLFLLCRKIFQDESDEVQKNQTGIIKTQYNIINMARTRSKGTASPKVATPIKNKKSGVAEEDSSAISPSVKNSKIKKPVKANKKVEVKETKKKESGKQEVQPQPQKQKQEQEQEAIAETNDDLVSNKLALKAISELAQFLDREKNNKSAESKNQLFDEDEDDETRKLYLQINSKKYFSDKPEFKPKLLKVSKSIYDQENVKTCLIIRDQLVSTSSEIEAIEAENLPTVSQIIPLKVLKSDYKNFEKRRQLYSQYDIFIVDDALINLMPTVLGKVFYDSGNNKVPLPVRVTNSKETKKLSLTTLKNQLIKCLESTYYLPPMGATVSIEIGSITSQFDHNQLAQNLLEVLKQVDSNLIKSIMLKTTNSPSLPLFYTEELFTDADKLENVESSKELSEDGVKLSAFEKGLLQLGEPSEVAKIIGKELKKQQSSKEKKLAKVSKLNKTKA